jgi:MSHA biogenesis protein MshQ
MSDLNVYTTSAINALTPITGDMVIDSDLNAVKLYDGAAWRVFNSDSTVVPYQNRWGASFDGSNDTLSVSDSSLDLKTDFSISCWFNRGSGVANWDALVSWGEASSGKYRAFGFNNSDNLTFNAYGMGYTYAGQTLSNSTWYHGVITLSGTGSSAVAKVYVNGVLDSTATGFGLVDYSTYGGHLFGASTYGGAERFEGEMDDLAIFNTVLDQTAVTALYNSGVPAKVTGAAGYWRMGDDSSDSATSGGSIATITDSSGNGNDATQATASSQPTFSDLTGETIYV